ncbi:Ig-like domain-containing protein [Actinoplanes sp. NPDC048988]|uniref:Ig-like domain-containing protein n=1 Tax=Actinoplanes sp. NPDC048988 TaxID=3363901 RepID=UPI00371B2772
MKIICIAVAAVLSVPSAASAASADRTAPSVTVTAPVAGALVKAAFTSSVTATDKSGISAAELWTGGRRVARLTKAPFKAAVNAAGKNGAVKLEWRVWDKRNNRRVVTRTVIVDSTAPVLTVTAPAPGSYIGANTTVTAKPSDARGIARVEFLIAGKVVGTDSVAPYAYTLTPAKIPASSASAPSLTRTFSVRAVDQAGNTRTTGYTYQQLPSYVAPASVSAWKLVSCKKEGGLMAGTYSYTITGGRYSELLPAFGHLRRDYGWNGAPATNAGQTTIRWPALEGDGYSEVRASLRVWAPGRDLGTPTYDVSLGDYTLDATTCAIR